MKQYNSPRLVINNTLLVWPVGNRPRLWLKYNLNEGTRFKLQNNTKVLQMK